MAQDGSPADSINNWQQENEDFGGLFRSSLSLAYGDDDDDTDQLKSSFLLVVCFAHLFFFDFK